MSISKSVSGYATERQFDKKLAEKAAVKLDAKAAKRHKFQKKWLSGMKNVVIVFYFLIIPMLETPNWCLDWFRADRHKLPGICIPCQEAYGGIIRYSNLPKLQPAVAYSIDVCCLVVLGVFKCFKLSWKRTSGTEKARIWGFILIELVCIGDLAAAGYTFSYPYLNNLLRPVVVVVFFSTIRENLRTLANDFKDSLIVLLSILAYIGYFSAVGLFIFRGTMTGYASFTTLGETFWALVILITTSNYPDVMLYAYNTSTWYTLYFVTFILFGVFFLMNVLLGVIFDNYKRHVELSSRNRSKRRMEIIERYYRQFDEENKGYLTIVQARRFFALTLDLNYHRKAHRDTFRQTLGIIDPERHRILLRDRVLEFFEIGGFAMLASLDKEQQNLDLSQDPAAEESELTDTDASFQANEADRPRTATDLTANSQEEARHPSLSASQLSGVKVTMMSAPAGFGDPASRTPGLDRGGYLAKEGVANLFASGVAATDDGSAAEEAPGWKQTWRRVVQSAPYAVLLVFFNVCSLALFGFALFVMDNAHSERYAASWVAGAVAVNALFLVDLIVHCLLFGFKQVIKQRKDYLLECVLQVGGLAAAVIFCAAGFGQKLTAVSFLAVVLMLRYLRLLTYAAELADFLKIVETFKRFSTPFAHMLATLYTVMFLFSVIGIKLYSGRITTASVVQTQIDAPYMYYLMNFNDFYASLMTLFHVIVINNWNNTVAMYCTVMGNNWPRVYFASFWILAVLNMFNLVISFVLEIYSSVGEEVEERITRQRLARQLMYKFKSRQELTEFVQKTFRRTFHHSKAGAERSTASLLASLQTASGVNPRLQARSPDQTMGNLFASDASLPNSNPSLLVESVGPSFLASSAYDSARATGGR